MIGAQISDTTMWRILHIKSKSHQVTKGHHYILFNGKHTNIVTDPWKISNDPWGLIFLGETLADYCIARTEGEIEASIALGPNAIALHHVIGKRMNGYAPRTTHLATENWIIPDEAIEALKCKVLITLVELSPPYTDLNKAIDQLDRAGAQIAAIGALWSRCYEGSGLGVPTEILEVNPSEADPHNCHWCAEGMPLLQYPNYTPQLSTCCR